MIKRNFLSNLSVAVVKESLMYLRKSEDLPTPNSPHKITFCSGIFTLAIFICLLLLCLLLCFQSFPMFCYIFSTGHTSWSSLLLGSESRSGLVWAFGQQVFSNWGRLMTHSNRHHYEAISRIQPMS